MPDSDVSLDDLIEDRLPASSSEEDPDEAALARATATAARALERKNKATKAVVTATEKAVKAIDHASTVVSGRDPMRDPDVRAVLPSKDKIRIYRREDDGKLHLVNDYSTEEIASDGDIAGFVAKRLRPSYGDFDYVIFTINSKGEITPHSTIPRREPRKDGENSTVAVLRTFVDALQKEKPVGEPKKDSIDEMQKLLSLVQGQRTDPMTLMMIPMLREAMGSMKPNPDRSEFVTVLSKVLDRLDAIEHERREPALPAFPTMPSVSSDPPAPAVDIAVLVKSISEAVRPATQTPAESPAKTLSELVNIMTTLQPQKKQEITVGEVIEHLTTALPLIKSMMGLDLLQAQLQQMTATIQQAQENRQQPTTALERTKTLSEQIDELVKTRKAAGYLLGVNPDQQQQRSGGDGGWGEVLMHMWNGLPDVIDRARGLARDISAARRQEKKATIEEASRASSVKDEPEIANASLAIPEDAAPFLRAMEEAEDSDSTIQAILGFFQKVSVMSGWKKYTMLLIYLAKQNKKDRILVVVKGLLGAMVESEHLTSDGAEKTYNNLTERVEDLMKVLKAASGGQ